MPADFLVRGGRVAIPPLGVFEVDVSVSEGRITGLLLPGKSISARRTFDAQGKVVLPGGIDPHTHIGYAAHRGMPIEVLPDQYESESASALFGGVTTLINTYRNDVSYTQIFDQLREAGETRSRVDFAYSFGILDDRHLEEIGDYYARYGVSSFKFYMAYRGTDARASGNASNRYTDGLLYEAMRRVAGIPGGMVMVHAENADIVERERIKLEGTGRDDLAAWSESRPDIAEAESINRALYFGRQAQCPVYVPHVSSSRSLAVCSEHRSDKRSRIYVEVCPHHLTHTKDSELGGLGKVNPPLRDSDDLSALWKALAGGVVDTVGSDHAGIRREDKGPTIWAATPGLPGIATRLPVLLNGVHEQRCTLEDVARVTAYGPARIFNLYPRKGTLMIGSDADLTIVDLELRKRVTSEALKSRADFTIYEGHELRGWPILTMVRGRVMMEDGEVMGPPGYGRYLQRFA